MKLRSAVIAMALVLTFVVSAAAAASTGNTENVVLEIGMSEIYASVPLFSYWYTQNEGQGITPKMTVINHGFSTIVVSAARLPGSSAALARIPREITPSTSADFALTENPHSLVIQKRAVKQPIIFTISKFGG